MQGIRGSLSELRSRTRLLTIRIHQTNQGGPFAFQVYCAFQICMQCTIPGRPDRPRPTVQTRLAWLILSLRRRRKKLGSIKVRVYITDHVLLCVVELFCACLRLPVKEHVLSHGANSVLAHDVDFVLFDRRSWEAILRDTICIV